MMISPETFYEENLKGKTKEQIMAVIRRLKRKINKLKSIVEHPEYIPTFHPSEGVQLLCTRDYLERAKQALEEIGGTYVPTATEKKAIEFDNNIPYINKVEFSIGGFFGGYKNKTYTIDGDKIHTDIDYSLIPEPSKIQDSEIDEMDKDYFFEALRDLHIGEWRRYYDTRRFGFEVCDGTQWHLEIYFSNGHKPVKIYGDNAYPYNFSRVLDLFEVEE